MKLLYKFDFVKFKDLDKPKYPDGFITHYIIDDMIGTNIFKNGRSLFTNLCIRNRHVTPSNIRLAATRNEAVALELFLGECGSAFQPGPDAGSQTHWTARQMEGTLHYQSKSRD